MTLSETEIDTYVAEGGVKCPYCQSEDLEASNQEFTEAGIFFDCACIGCLHEWKEHYKLASITSKEDDDRVHGTSN